VARLVFWWDDADAAGQSSSTTAWSSQRFRALRIDVGAKVTYVEAKVLPELDDWEAIFSVRLDMLVHPRNGYLEQPSGVPRRQQGVINLIDAERCRRVESVRAGHRCLRGSCRL